MTAEYGTGVGIAEECRDVNPVGAVRVVYHREDFHPWIVSLQKRHDSVIHGSHRAALNDVEILVRLIVHSLKMAVGS